MRRARLNRLAGASAAAVRRSVTVPGVIVLDLLVLATAPITLAVSALVGLAARSSLPLRSTALVVAYASIEISLLPRLLRAEETDWNALLRDVL
ncbi:MAG: hypothetical protein QOI16_1216, partial [Pseudonocardiales bacterium]|nr:hypothetical protein [Pseudonocardiales bacterium]